MMQDAIESRSVLSVRVATSRMAGAAGGFYAGAEASRAAELPGFAVREEWLAGDLDAGIDVPKLHARLPGSAMRVSAVTAR